jgi:Mrp family chromosome partitioning ATPase/capsular polysaccharide biosynthesis protein
MTDARALTGDEQGLSWRDSLEIVRHQWFLLVLAVVLLGGGAMLWTDSHKPTPLYRASAQVLLELRATGSPFKSAGGVEDPRRAMPTEIARLGSDEVQEAVVKQLGSAPPVSADAVGDSDMFAITAVSPSPKTASDTANAYADAYVAHRRQRALDAYEVASDALRSRMETFDEQIAELTTRIGRGTLDDAALDEATERRAGYEEQRSILEQRLVQYQVDSLAETGGARVFRAAGTPSAPFNGADPMRSGVLGAALGLVLGLAVIVVREYFADLIRNPRQITGLVGLPVLGIVPGDGHRRLPPGAGEGRMSDPYRDVRSALLTSAPHSAVGILQISSPSGGSDTATTALNIGLAFARAGRRVVVVSTDFAGGPMQDLVDLTTAPGLATAMSENVSAMTVVHSSLSTPNLMVLQAGPLPPGTDAADLLAMPQADLVFSELANLADLIIIETPRVLGSAVATTVATRASAVVLVVRAGLTRRTELRRAQDALTRVGASVVGVVFHGQLPARASRRERDVLLLGDPRPATAGGNEREEQVAAG